MPRVSWVMPVKNAAPFLPSALASIAAQTWSDHEVLAWDNGSSDGSVDVLREWIPARLPGRVVADRPLVLGRARAELLAASQGELIAHLDADDISEPDRLSRQIAALDANPNLVAVGAWARLIDAEGRPTGEVWDYPTEPLAIRWRMFFANCLVTSSILMRKEAALRAGSYRPLPFAQDYDLWMRLLRQGDIANLPRCLVRYRRHPAGLTSTISQARRTQRARELAVEHAPWLFPDVPLGDCLRVWERHAYHGTDRGPPTGRTARTARRMVDAACARERCAPEALLLDPHVRELTERPRLRTRARELAGTVGARAAQGALRWCARAAHELAPETSDPGDLRHLVLFFTRGMSLGQWAQLGILDRELRIFRSLLQEGVRVSLLTWGGPEEEALAPAGMDVLCNRWRLSQDAYASLLPVLHGRVLREADVIKTHQTKGADAALRAAELWAKPLVVRCGYSYSFNIAQRHGEGSAETLRARRLEARVFGAAQRVVATSERIAELARARAPNAVVSVVPNYVDDQVFRPHPEIARDLDLVTVGHLQPWKNTTALLEAAETLGLRVAVAGDGPLRERLEGRFGERAGVHFLGTVPNLELPRLFARARLFVLPSLYEGHPKAPIEAMACGLPVVASAVPGLTDLLEHGQTGWLCPVDAPSLQQAITQLFDDDALREDIAARGRAFVLERFGLERVLPLERQLLHEVVSQPRAPDPWQ